MYYVIVQSSQYNKHTFSFEKKKDAIDFVADQFEIRLKLFSEKKDEIVLKLKIKDLNKACESLQAKDVNLNDVTFTKESMPEYRIFCENSRYFKRKILVWKTDKVHGHFHGIAYMVCNEQYRRITYGCHSWNDDEEKSMRKFIWPFVSTLSYQELTGTEDEIKYVCELIKQYVKYNELEKLQFNVF